MRWEGVRDLSNTKKQVLLRDIDGDSYPPVPKRGGARKCPRSGNKVKRDALRKEKVTLENEYFRATYPSCNQVNWREN